LVILLAEDMYSRYNLSQDTGQASDIT